MEATRQRMERLEREQETQRRQQTAVVSRTLSRRVRNSLQLQLRRKEQINKILRKGLISMRKQLHLKTTRIRKYKLQNEKLTEEMEERIENKNETIVDLHIQVQCMKKEVEQFALREKAIQSQKEQLTQEITAMNASLQNQVYENAIQANRLTDLQQQLDQKEETIAYMLDYRQNLEDNYLTIQEKMDLLDHEMDQMVQERNLMLHYVVTMQACLYNDVEQWLNQLLEYDHISEGSMHKFKSVREQINLLKPILARNRAGLDDEYEEEEEEEDDDEDDDEDEEEEDEEEEEEEEEEEGEDWETTDSEVAAVGQQKEEGVEEQEKEMVESQEVEEGEKQIQEEKDDEEEATEEEEEEEEEDFFRFRHQHTIFSPTHPRRKNVIEDTSESPSHHTDSSQSTLSSRSTSSTDTSDSTTSTSSESAGNVKAAKRWAERLPGSHPSGDRNTPETELQSIIHTSRSLEKPGQLSNHRQIVVIAFRMPVRTAQPAPARPLVEVDAMDVGVGAVLYLCSGPDNRLHPCAFYSRRFTTAEANYDVGNHELLPIKLALEEWRHLLKGAEQSFVVWTDRKNLTYIQSAKRLNSLQARQKSLMVEEA